jgi:phosphohistidine phosphatase
MRTLLLVRHAKSSRDDPSLPDKERPLNDRGERDAPKMAKRLAKGGLEPDLILSSSAVRALTTAQLMAEKLDYKAKHIVVEDRLYAASPEAVLKIIRELGDKPKCVMLVGHNPELSELAHRLSDSITDMPTCAVAEFVFDMKSWSELGKQQASGVQLHTPKD